MEQHQGSVTQWIGKLCSGNTQDRNDAAAVVWNRYQRQLFELAERRLSPQVRVREGASDIVVKAINSFCLRMRNDPFPQVNDREDIARILTRMTVNKARKAARDHGRGKRGVQHETPAGGAAGRDEEALSPVHVAPDHAPTPDEAVALTDLIGHWLRLLPEEYRIVAEGKLDGHTDEDLAKRLDVSVKTVERRKELVRAVLLALEDQTDEEIATALKVSREGVGRLLAKVPELQRGMARE